MCKAGIETIEHIFTECSVVHGFWDLMGFKNDVNIISSHWLTTLRYLHPPYLSNVVTWTDLFLFVIWNIWLNRNNNNNVEKTSFKITIKSSIMLAIDYKLPTQREHPIVKKHAPAVCLSLILMVLSVKKIT